jgi:Ca2+-binding EF-hand superfamily protein
MADGVTVQEYQEAFAYFDGDRDGKINKEEFGRLLRAVGHAPTEAELAALRKAVDRIYGGCECRTVCARCARLRGGAPLS